MNIWFLPQTPIYPLRPPIGKLALLPSPLRPHSHLIPLRPEFCHSEVPAVSLARCSPVYLGQSLLDHLHVDVDCPHENYGQGVVESIWAVALHPDCSAPNQAGKVFAGLLPKRLPWFLPAGNLGGVNAEEPEAEAGSL